MGSELVKPLQKLRWNSELLITAKNPTMPSTMATSKAMPQPIRMQDKGDLPRGAGGGYIPAGVGWPPRGRQAAPSQ